MNQKLLSFVWTHGKADTIKTLLMTFLTFPVIYISLEIPKIIVNDALGAGKEPVAFPTSFLGMSLDQMSFLMVLCFIFITMIVLNNGLKYLLNIQIGLTSERMLRRLRFALYERVMRFRISRFQHMKQGEIVQSVMGEVDPLGGFFGEVISTPVWQGGMLIVYTTFIFMQDPLLGAAAIALYPLQAYVIPKLQKRVVRLNRDRVANVRRIADHIGESVGVMDEIHVSGTARWHLATVAERLHQSFVIRLAIFKRKYLIKGLNNFLIALTPFAFYLFGGIQVIQGNLEIGSLVAVLAAYKDVAGPWKELLNYFQRWSDLNSRYELVVESFSGDEVYGPERIYDDAPILLTGDLTLKGVTVGGGSSGLKSMSCTAPEGRYTAVLGGTDGAREIMLKSMAGLVAPDAGRITIGRHNLAEASLPAIGQSLAYVSGDSAFFAGSLRENLTYSLRKSPASLSDAGVENAAYLLAEAENTGNIAASPFGDWTDYAAAGVPDAEALNAHIVQLAEKIGFAEELYHLGLQARMDPAEHRSVAERIEAARAELSQAAANDPTVADIVEFWDAARFNENATLMENVLFGMPVAVRKSVADYASDPIVLEVLEGAGAIPVLVRAGLAIAEQLTELLGTVDEDSALLDSFADYSKKDILESGAIVEAARAKPDYEAKDDERRILLSLALAFVPVRDRLDVVDEAMKQDILDIRAKTIPIVRERPCFVSFGEDCYSPALTLSENLIDGKRRHDRRSAWRRLDGFLEEAIERGGLRPGITEVGLSAPLTAGGGGLSATSKKRAALVRALLKRPATLIIDGIALGVSEPELALRAALQREMAGRTLIMATNDAETARGTDHVILIDTEGHARDGAPEKILAEA